MELKQFGLLMCHCLRVTLPLARRGRKSKQKLAVTMTGDLFVIRKHMIDPYSKGNKIIA